MDLEEVEVEEVEDNAEEQPKRLTVGMEAFNVVEKSNEGAEMPLTLPDGTPTDSYLIIRGQDSKDFRRAQAQSSRKRIDLMKRAKSKNMSAAAVAMAEKAITTELVAVLVAGWSFGAEATKENVIAWLKTAPQVEIEIDNFAGERANFFKKPSPN